MRLYFYERERPIAERAAASIEASYKYLSAEFSYKPKQTFAYFLYASYIEFLQTDLYPLQEGVLGVTSPETLEVTLADAVTTISADYTYLVTRWDIA